MMNAYQTALVMLSLLWFVQGVLAADGRPGLQRCRLQGLETEAWCGVIQRPLDPAHPQGRQIEVHYAVLAALARNPKPDPVFFFAGGPGQSAVDLAGPVSRLTSRLLNRRDVVLVDQRGTGRSAPLTCEEPALTAPLAEATDPARVVQRMRECQAQLVRLPHGDLRQYTTTVAMQDVEAVRVALGAERVNLVGGSYGTRAALEYQRLFPAAVRRLVIDGVAPPDMALPASFSTDNQAALEAVFSACEAESACRQRRPALRQEWATLLAGLPRTVTMPHPVTGQPQPVEVTRAWVLGLVRLPLYAPALAAALPQAIHDASRGRYEALVGLALAASGGRNAKLAEGMHFSVVCAEDLPRLALSIDKPGADYGDIFASQYREICASWPRTEVAPAFYTLGRAPAATWVLSGGADPVTPPRHGQRVAEALGAKARHVVVPQAGHGVMGLGCMRDAIFHFVDAATDDLALRVEAECARRIPRPADYAPISARAAP